MDAIDKAQSVIQDRLRALTEEEKRLEKALKALVHSDSKKKGQPSATGRTRKRAPRGQREKQLLASIKKHPNYKQTEHAKAIGISSNQVYGLVSKMSKTKQIRKNKDGTLSAA